MLESGRICGHEWWLKTTTATATTWPLRTLVTNGETQRIWVCCLALIQRVVWPAHLESFLCDAWALVFCAACSKAKEERPSYQAFLDENKRPGTIMLFLKGDTRNGLVIQLYWLCLSEDVELNSTLNGGKRGERNCQTFRGVGFRWYIYYLYICDVHVPWNNLTEVHSLFYLSASG